MFIKTWVLLPDRDASTDDGALVRGELSAPVYTWNTGRRLSANCLAGNTGQDMVAFSEPCPRVPLHRSDVGQTPGGVDKSRQ